MSAVRRRRAIRRRRLVALSGLIGVIAVAVVVAIAVSGHSHTSPSASSGLTREPVTKIPLASPTGAAGTSGIAKVVRRGKVAAIAIVGKGVPHNSPHNAYAIWLYNSPTDAVRLGFVNPGVGKNGHLDTAGGLPANAADYKQVLVTLETTPDPSSPGPIVLEGTFTDG
jgi:hypothetical protein